MNELDPTELEADVVLKGLKLLVSTLTGLDSTVMVTGLADGEELLVVVLVFDGPWALGLEAPQALRVPAARRPAARSAPEVRNLPGRLVDVEVFISGTFLSGFCPFVLVGRFVWVPESREQLGRCQLEVPARRQATRGGGDEAGNLAPAALVSKWAAGVEAAAGHVCGRARLGRARPSVAERAGQVVGVRCRGDEQLGVGMRRALGDLLGRAAEGRAASALAIATRWRTMARLAWSRKPDESRGSRPV